MFKLVLHENEAVKLIASWVSCKPPWRRGCLVGYSNKHRLIQFASTKPKCTSFVCARPSVINCVMVFLYTFFLPFSPEYSFYAQKALCLISEAVWHNGQADLACVKVMYCKKQAAAQIIMANGISINPPVIYSHSVYNGTFVWGVLRRIDVFIRHCNQL